MNPDSKLYHLLTVAQEFAPTGEIQAKLAQACNDALANGNTDTEVTVILCGMMIDGLSHGNW